MNKQSWTYLFAAVGCTVIVAAEASACPMCSTSLAEGQNQALPSAFYYSILFMLSMPFLLLGAFGAAFYRLSRLPQTPRSETAAEEFGGE